jgi:hypothetical protein
MKRTRKWAYVAQEASRLTALGLKPSEIAAQLEVSKSTVTRWIAKGKLPRIVVSNPEPANPVQARQTPAEWATSVREEYALDATDDQLVTLGESALRVSFDMAATAPVRLVAAGRFQAIVRQLALVTRRATAEQVSAPVAVAAPPKRPVLVRRPKADPRKGLMAIK